MPTGRAPIDAPSVAVGPATAPAGELAPTKAQLDGLRIELANGNGVRGMAAWLRGFFLQPGDANLPALDVRQVLNEARPDDRRQVIAVVAAVGVST